MSKDTARSCERRFARIGPETIRRHVREMLAQEAWEFCAPAPDPPRRHNAEKHPTGPRPIDLAQLVARCWLAKGECDQ